MTEPDPQASIAAAIRRHREAAGMSQETLGAAVARHEDRPQAYGQSTVQKWENGEVDLRPARIEAIERALGLRSGTLTRLAGSLPLDARQVRTVAEAVEADPRLTPQQRRALLAAYREMVRGE